MGWTFSFRFYKILIFSKHAPEIASTEFNIYLSQLKEKFYKHDGIAYNRGVRYAWVCTPLSVDTAFNVSFDDSDSR